MRLHGAAGHYSAHETGDLEAMAQCADGRFPSYQPFDMPQHGVAERCAGSTGGTTSFPAGLYTIESEKHEVIGSLTLREIDAAIGAVGIHWCRLCQQGAMAPRRCGSS